MYDSLHKLDLDLGKSMGGLHNNGLGVTGRKKCIDLEKKYCTSRSGYIKVKLSRDLDMKERREID